MNNNNTWRFIASNNIQVELSDCKYAEEIHEVLKDAFGFPADYGKNWDALWDCLRDFALSEERTREVVITGVDQMPKELQVYFQKAIQIFCELETKYPVIQFKINDAD